MTREEQIETIARENYYYNLHRFFGFEKGAEWADSHPDWHKYPDEKPPLTEEGFEIPVLVCLKDGYMTIGMRNEYSETINMNWQIYSPTGINEVPYDEVIAWMKLPQPPKFN